MKRALIACWLVSAAACSLFRSRPAPYPEGLVLPLEEAGRVEFPGRALKALVRSGGRLYLTTDKGALLCLDGPGREILWTYTAPAAWGCPPAAGPDLVAAWDTAGTVRGLSLEGRLIWETPLPETPSSDIAMSGDRLYVGTREGALYALGRASGEVLWKHEAGAAIEAGCVFWREAVVLASTDGRIQVLGPDGRLRYKWEAGSAVRVTPLVDGDSLYFGADDGGFRRFDLRARRLVWSQRAGARILSPPLADSGRVYFGATNTVLYALEKSGGDIVWWKILPSRSPFPPGFAGNAVLAGSASSVLVVLERRTGREKGRHDAGLEARSQPDWSPPEVLLAVYDPDSDKGGIVRLRKLVKVELSASAAPPAAVGAEVVFTAAAVGFHLPTYEFYIRKDTGLTVAQEASAKNSWTWFPESEGQATVGVRVVDARQKREAEMKFEVANPK